ncbi:MAG: VOC family protein [Spirochaetales bacterium]|jgi:catechol 2,3-dioxygenase-like lactoylglutathione lyase family enzyme|nr:VOC family protein [Spirochaetales bacterium]
MIKKVDHAGLSVSNLEKSIEFYSGLLGLEVERILEPAPERDLGRVNGIPGSKARIAHLRKGEAAMLELFEYLDPRGKPLPAGHKQADIGFIHVGFASSDVREDYRRLREKGVQFLGEPVEFRPTVWVVYFRGPDGEVGELREV